MKNTKTEYTSSQRTPVVLPEMEQLLPPLSAEQFSSLERDIQENGCYTPVDTRKEMARAVGIGEQAMGRITRLSEEAPQVLKEALERKEVSVNRGWKILKAVQQLPTENRETAAAEMIAAVQEIDQIDAEANRRGKISSLFCKAYERAVLLTPTLENIRCWVEGTRMRPKEIEDAARESYALAQVFQTIGDVLRHEFLPCQEGKLDTESENQGVA